MFKIGCHLSAGSGYAHMAKDAISIGATTFQFFTRNPRGGKAKAIQEKDIQAFLALAGDNDIHIYVAHAPYTLNLCSGDAHIRQFALDMLKDDLQRMEYTPGNLYNFHPGSHVGQGIETGIDIISGALNDALFPEMTTTVLLETMAGKGSEVGSRFEELRAIIDKVELNEKVGVCLDTCHVFDAGYDIVHKLDEVLDEFDRIIGLNRLKAIHLNDSMNPFESHKDRHAKIGEGHIGKQALIHVTNHPRLKDLPFVLETPNDLDGYKREIELLKENRI